jgi:hypothetical protein
MNIFSIDKTKRYGTSWGIERPSFIFDDQVILEQYVVQRGEEMRLDLVMQSIYGEDVYYESSDVILHINGIDNPLNIREGMVILFPAQEQLNAFRYEEEEESKVNQTVKERLGVLNQTTRKDEKRKKFLESDYSLPPVVLRESRPGVVITPTEIIIGGVK